MTGATKRYFKPIPKRVTLSRLAQDNGFVKVDEEGKYVKQITLKRGEQEIVICDTCGGGYVAVKQSDGKFKKYLRQDAVNFLKQKQDAL